MESTALMFGRWNKEQLYDKYYADPATVQKEAGVG